MPTNWGKKIFFRRGCFLGASRCLPIGKEKFLKIFFRKAEKIGLPDAYHLRRKNIFSGMLKNGPFRCLPLEEKNFLQKGVSFFGRKRAVGKWEENFSSGLTFTPPKFGICEDTLTTEWPSDGILRRDLPKGSERENAAEKAGAGTTSGEPAEGFHI